MTTGMFPQEITINLGDTGMKIKDIYMSTTNSNIELLRFNW